MAIQTVPQAARPFDVTEARAMLRHTEQAAAIMRAVSLATLAQEDGAVSYPDNSCSRWGPAVEAACDELYKVRDWLMSASGPTRGANWWVPLAMLEAAGAALWRTGEDNAGDSGMTTNELQQVSDATIARINALRSECLEIAKDLEVAAA